MLFLFSSYCFPKINMTNDEVARLLQASISGQGVQEVLQIPRRSDGSFYEIDDLAPDQKVSLAEVLYVLKQYCEGNYVTVDNVFRLTVSGTAGSGKSTWINTLVTCVRRIFFQ